MGNKPVYVLGVGLSHNGSAVLLKDGQVLVGIEKERLSRIKHDGGNDTLAVRYCLDAAAIAPSDLVLVVQCANFEVPDRSNYNGPRVWGQYPDVPLVSISHHLAHAYSAVGTCPFQSFDVLVVDGCGSPFPQCTDLDGGGTIHRPDGVGMYCEKDSYYRWNGKELKTLWKDFSEMATPGSASMRLPTTRHSIGGFYAAISGYCFGNMDDAGKLMGLAPYGKQPMLQENAFGWNGDRLLVREEALALLNCPANGYEDFKQRFAYFANVALWAQQQVEQAVSNLVKRRQGQFDARPLAYTGGVALNAVANGKLLRNGVVEELYLEPAAGDNGLALGCAYYGWLETLNQPIAAHNGNTCFGRTYTHAETQQAVESAPSGGYDVTQYASEKELVSAVAQQLQQGRVVGWYQDGSEFGPRALGHRSILALPGIPGLRDHINREVKFREDFRPFAPAVLKEDAALYFKYAWESPYMILVDEVLPEWRDKLQNVVHVNGSARVQTVTPEWNSGFYELLRAVKKLTGNGVLLNTSFNKRRQPMVERPEEALALFQEAAIDALVMGNRVVSK